jgi:hypothetical protein
MEFDKLWDEYIKPLKGTSVFTASENKENIIHEVTDEYLIRISSNKLLSPKIPKSLFAEIYERVKKEGMISRTQINMEYQGRRSSIVLAVMGELPNIKILKSPLRIVYLNDEK